MNQSTNQGQGQYQKNSVQNLQENHKRSKNREKREYYFNTQKMDETEKILRQPRSNAYLAAIEAIDMLSLTDEEIIEKLKADLDEETAEEFAEMSPEELLEEIKACFAEEFAALDVKIESILGGVLSKCYINGCDLHAISSTGDILDHFRADQPLPEQFAKGRQIYKKYPDCKCIEVYSNCYRVVQNNGTVVKVSARGEEI